ncbi:MAG TPA: sporulation protein [Clostridium sp.]|jgi:uncharacterized spore protein YtfJ|nr:sporulation protein [Clostridia bacterium]HCW04412.1 sporulation protein [Clostridium sp.]
MQDTTSFNNNMNTLFSDLEDFVKTGSVLGSPMEVENKTLIPIMSVTMGYGSTGMGTKSSMGTGAANTSSGGLGLGARVSSNCLVVIDNNNNSIQMLPVNSNNNMNQLMSKIPDAITSLGQSMMGGQSQQQGGSQQQKQQAQGQAQGQAQNQQSQNQAQGQQSNKGNSQNKSS